MKHVIFLGDGMGDHPQERLGGRTAIAAAHTPHMDAIARRGACGLLRTVPAGLAPDSTVANLSVMGYDPRQCLEGRGVLEAAAMGVSLAPDDHAMRLNLIHVRDGLIISHSAGNIATDEAAELIAALNKGLSEPDVECFAGVSYRHVLKLSRPVSKAISCHPPHDHLDEPVDDFLPTATEPEGEATAALLRDLIARSRDILETHPVNRRRAEAGRLTANLCWPWSIGRRPAMATFHDLFGLRGAVVAAVDLIRGIGVYAGMTSPVIPGATGLWDTSYENKAAATLRLLEDHDLVYVHVEAPDEAGHEGDLDLKVRTIEDLDRRLIRPVMEALEGREARFAVLPDHYTPVALRTHVPEPAPFAICGPGVAPDAVDQYGEDACAKGDVGVLVGDEFMRCFTQR